MRRNRAGARAGAGAHQRVRGAIDGRAVLSLICMFIALMHARPAHAQRADTGEAVEAGLPLPDSSLAAIDAPYASMRVYLLTMGPGDAVWELFGHNAILLRDETRGIDVAFNYGMFSFDQPGFVRRLMQGRMLYRMQPVDGTLMLLEYEVRNRHVWAQELNLTAAEKRELAMFLEWNAQPQNSEYLYEPFLDNCSTRVRDVLDRLLDGQLRSQLEAVPTDETFRSHSLRLTADALGAYTGLLLALGQPTDRPLTEWGAAFIPMELRDAVANAHVTRDDGTSASLVLSEATLVQAQREPPPEDPPGRMFAFLLIGMLIGGMMLGLGHVAGRSRAARMALLVVALLWALTVGLFGTTLGAMWAFTDHGAVYRNENLFVVNPLGLLVAGLLLPALLARRALWPAFLAAAALAGLAIAGVLLQALPGLDQQNGEILALTVPAHVALAVVMYFWWRQQMSPREDSRRTRLG